MSETARSIEREQLQRQARADIVRVLYKQAFPGFVVAMVSATILLLGIWESIDHVVALAWFGSVVATSLARLALFVAWWNVRPAGTDALDWERPFMWTLLASAGAWGLGVVAILPSESLTMQLFCIVFLMGMAGGAMSAYSSVPRIAALTELVLLVPVTAWAFSRGTFMYALLGVALAMALGAFLRAIRDIAGTLFANVLGGYEVRAASELAQRSAAELRRRNVQLAESERRFRQIAENTADAIWILDTETLCASYVSPAVERLLGYTPREIERMRVDAIVTPESLGRLLARSAEVRERLDSHGDPAAVPSTFEADLRHKNGRVVSVEATAALQADADGNYRTALVITRDVSDRRRATESLQRLAFFDPLTELPNRRLLIDRLQQSIALARRNGSRVTLLFVDIDHFKSVNDRHGHHAGDGALQTVAARLRACIRESDTAARIGGDEFVVLLPDAETVDDGNRVAECIRSSLERPIETSTGAQLSMSCSIGIAIYPDHAGNEWDLLRIGDDLMYAAKQAGRNRVVYADPSRGRERSAWIEREGSVHLQWKDAYACGDAGIDAAHEELFAQSNRLMEFAREHDGDVRGVLAAFDSLLGEVSAHFDDEETVLERIGYPSADSHAALHRDLLDRAARLRRRAERGEVPVGELTDFLTIDVVSRHMLREDSKFFPILRARQLRARATAEARQD